MSSLSSSTRETDPLLSGLSEKKQSFRRSVVSLAAELKEVRSRLSYQEQSFAKDSLTRQEAEAKARDMEEEICRLQKSLDERNIQLQASSSDAEKYLEELENLRSQISSTKTTAETSAACAQSAQFQCVALLKELDDKNISLIEHDARVTKLEEQLDLLKNSLQARESSQKQLKDEFQNILNEDSPRNLEKINELLTAKDEEIAHLRDEIRVISDHQKHKAMNLESQLEKHRRADQELKKRVLKLEFCLQEARAQTRKLQRMGERRDKALKELRDELATKSQSQSQGGAANGENQNFWESSGFKIVVSMSMLVLVLLSKH